MRKSGKPNLILSEPTRSTSWSIESEDDTILQAVHLGNGALLCHNTGRKLTLLSRINTGTTFIFHVDPIYFTFVVTIIRTTNYYLPVHFGNGAILHHNTGRKLNFSTF